MLLLHETLVCMYTVQSVARFLSFFSFPFSDSNPCPTSEVLQVALAERFPNGIQLILGNQSFRPSKSYRLIMPQIHCMPRWSVVRTGCGLQYRSLAVAVPLRLCSVYQWTRLSVPIWRQPSLPMEAAIPTHGGGIRTYGGGHPYLWRRPSVLMEAAIRTYGGSHPYPSLCISCIY